MKVISNTIYPHYLLRIVEITPSRNYIFTAKKNGPSKITSVTELKIENGQTLIEITRLKGEIENLT